MLEESSLSFASRENYFSSRSNIEVHVLSSVFLVLHAYFCTLASYFSRILRFMSSEKASQVFLTDMISRKWHFQSDFDTVIRWIALFLLDCVRWQLCLFHFRDDRLAPFHSRIHNTSYSETAFRYLLHYTVLLLYVRGFARSSYPWFVTVMVLLDDSFVVVVFFSNVILSWDSDIQKKEFLSPFHSFFDQGIPYPLSFLIQWQE